VPGCCVHLTQVAYSSTCLGAEKKHGQQHCRGVRSICENIVLFLATCFTATCRRRGCFHKLLGSATLPVLCALPCGRVIHVVGVIRLLSVNSFCLLMLWPRGSQMQTQVCCNCRRALCMHQRLVFLGPKMGSPKGRKLIPHAMAPDCS
jgi:hypothetical protein